MKYNTNLIGREIIIVDDEKEDLVGKRAEIVGFNIGTYAFYIAIKNGKLQGNIYGYNSWAGFRLTEYYIESDLPF